MNLWHLYGLGVALAGVPLAPRDQEIETPRLYFTESMQTTLQLGEPPQKLLASVNTLHWESFAVSSMVINCSEVFPYDEPCSYIKGTLQSPLFDVNASRSARIIERPFKPHSLSAENMTGYWVSDVLTLRTSKNLKSVDGFRFGLVDRTQITPVVGLAYPTRAPRLSITGFLKAAGLIYSPSYSVWVHSPSENAKAIPDSDTIGTITFGAVNTNGYRGSLYTVPMIPRPTNETLIPATVLHGLSWGSKDSDEVPLVSMAQRFELNYNAEITTGMSVVPRQLYDIMKTMVQVSTSGNQTLVDCNTLNTFRWNFSGAVIETPVTSFLDLTSITSGDEGKQLCPLNLRPGKHIRFNMEVLKNFYVVVDFDKLLIGLAQAEREDSGEDDLVKITASSIPGSQQAANFGSTETSNEIKPQAQKQQSAMFSMGTVNEISMATVFMAAAVIYMF